MASWIGTRKNRFREGMSQISRKDKLVIAQPFFPLDRPIDGHTIIFADDTIFKADSNFHCDIYFTQGYAPDQQRIVYVEETQRALITATWFWDNHHLIADTMHSAILSDIYFYAHNYKSSYITNKLSTDGGFVPLCPVFWQIKDVEQAATSALLAPRLNQLYGGYNSYLEFPERDVQIKEIQSHIENNNIFVTPHGTPPEKHPFYGMSAADRLLEWMRYKVSLCLSFNGNTACRIFDTLLAGGIPLIVGRPHDLDAVIPRHMQEMLPVIVVDDLSVGSIASAHQRALEIFDAMGAEGVMTRHIYTKENHMPANRLATMIEKIVRLSHSSLGE